MFICVIWRNSALRGALRRRKLGHDASRPERLGKALADFATHARTMALAGARAAISENWRSSCLSAFRYRSLRVRQNPRQHSRSHRSGDRRRSRRCQQLKPSPRPSAGERRAAAGWRAARRMTIANRACRSAMQTTASCHAGCEQVRVVAALRSRGLWEDKSHPRLTRPAQVGSRPATAAARVERPRNTS